MRTHLRYSLFASWCAGLRNWRWRRVHRISPQHLHMLLSQAGAPLVLDVRNPEEFVGARGHIAEAVLVPFPTLAQALSELQPSRTRPIVTV